MSEGNNSENLHNTFYTPKKRATYSYAPCTQTSLLSSEKNKKERFSTPKTECKKTKISNDIFYKSAVKISMITSTPMHKKGQSFSTVAKKYYINGELGNEIGDVYEELKKLDEYKVKTTEIIENLSHIIDINNSSISSAHLDLNIVHPLERCIIDYPKFFDTSSFSKFINKSIISSTKSSMISICENRFNGKSYIVKSGLKPDSECRCLTDSSRAIINEVKILTLIGRHVHIVDYYDSWIEDESFLIQLELVRGGSLLDFIIGNKKMLTTVCDMSKSEKTQRLSNGSALVLLAQVSSVLAYLHDVLHVFHGNINPSNILVDLYRYISEDAKGECHNALLESNPNRLLRFKLCDFGQSGVINTATKMKQNTARYLPILNDNRVDYHLLVSSRDVQSLGLTIYNCLGGVINSETSRDIQKGIWKMWPDNLSDEWRLIIQKMSHVNEINRLSAREIIEMDNVKAFVLPESLCYLRYEDDVGAPSANIMDTN